MSWVDIAKGMVERQKQTSEHEVMPRNEETSNDAAITRRILREFY